MVKKTIAWVDYEPKYVKFYQDGLKNTFPGTEIDHFNTGTDFRTAVKSRPYDLIVMEPIIIPPESDTDLTQTGLSLVREIRASGHNIETPIVFYTIESLAELERKCVEQCGYDFQRLKVKALRKPECVLLSEMVLEVKEYLR
ncbi:MAG TPA: hypothetical protein VJA23_01805 [Candidatus Nanoarchaeia archaeon]|nr:hypothetical protein [Candidatus Nanoarchaeia archaeon]